MAKIIPITEHFQHFLAEIKRKFLGRSVWPDQAGVEAVFRSRLAAAARPLCGARELSAAAQPAAALPQRVLPAGFRDPLRHHPAAGGAHPGEEFSAARTGTVSAPGGGSGDADPGGVLRGSSAPGRRGGW